jgi:exocyst complex component 6
VERLSSQYLGQIVQILINLEHFELACHELELLLAAARSQNSTGTSIALRATEKFKSNKKAAEKRIFEVVNSKIDDLIETAEYEWMSPHPPSEPSNYMQTLTRFLSNIMNSTLLGLPTEIKELIYFDALSHAANMILVRSPLPLYSTMLFPIPILLTVVQGSTSGPRSEVHQSQRRRRTGQGC